MATNSTHLAAGTLSRDLSVRSRTVESWSVATILGLVMTAVWTPLPQGDAVLFLCTLAAIMVLTVRTGFSARQLGLTRPASGTLATLAAGMVLMGVVAAGGFFAARIFGAAHPVPWHRAWQYGIWAFVQEFMLQSFFFVKLESIMGGRQAVWATSLLFAVAHVPNPLLTPLSFLGALFFCEAFRRYRNLYSLGVIHAALGLTIAASFPDSLLHHMRVGIGYLMYHTR